MACKTLCKLNKFHFLNLSIVFFLCKIASNYWRIKELFYYHSIGINEKYQIYQSRTRIWKKNKWWISVKFTLFYRDFNEKPKCYDNRRINKQQIVFDYSMSIKSYRHLCWEGGRKIGQCCSLLIDDYISPHSQLLITKHPRQMYRYHKINHN